MRDRESQGEIVDLHWLDICSLICFVLFFWLCLAELLDQTQLAAPFC